MKIYEDSRGWQFSVRPGLGGKQEETRMGVRDVLRFMAFAVEGLALGVLVTAALTGGW